MNHCVFTGWLHSDADTRVTPGGREVLWFHLVVRDAGEEHALPMRVNDPALVTKCRPWLTRGRTAVVHCTARKVPIYKGGGIANETTVFVVSDAEFPNRSKPVEAEKAEAAHAQ